MSTELIATMSNKRRHLTKEIDGRLHVGSKHEIPIENESYKRACIRMYLQKETADVHFIFNGTGEVEKRIPAHKLLLANRSPVFQSMFYGKLKEVADISITDCRFESFKEFLQFFYFADVKLTMEHVADVMYLVKQYDATECFKICDQFLLQNFSTQTACWVLELVILFNRTDCRQLLLKKMMETPNGIFATVSFKNCTLDVLTAILGCKQANCSEKSFFQACINWATNACVKQKLDPSDMANVRQQLGDCLYLIQFAAMSRTEIYECVSEYRALFSKDELIDIIVAMTSYEADNLPTLKYFVYKTRAKNNTIAFRVIEVKECDLLYVETNCFMTSKKVSLTALATHIVEPKTDRTVSSINGIMKIGEMSSENHVEQFFFTQPVVLSVSAYRGQSSVSANFVELAQPVVLQNNRAYCVRFEFATSSWFSQRMFTTKKANWKESIFSHDGLHVVGRFGLISSLYFDILYA